MDDALFLALDYGGTKLSAALTTRRLAAETPRAWLGLERVQSLAGKDARYDVETMLTLARRLLGGSTPAAIGVSFGGPVDARAGRVILSHHVPGWEDTPLRDQLQAAFGAPASVDNDANVAALGESRFGAGRGCASLFYVTVSTGVGGGWVIDGKIYSGADGMAGEIGHTIVSPPFGTPPWSERTRDELPLCICERRGCVESLACGPALARYARERLVAETAAGPILRALTGYDLNAVTAEVVARAASQGDELAQRVVDRAAQALGFGIGTAITLGNPQRVVLGGGVTKSGARYFEQVRQAARTNTLPQVRVDIVPAALGDDAPLWGAVALAEAEVSRQ